MGYIASLNKNEHTLEQYLLLFILLCFSGNPYFIEGFGKNGYIFLGIFVMLWSIVRKKIDIFNTFLVYVTPFLLIHMYHIFCFPEVKIATIVFFMLKTFIGIGILRLIGRSLMEKFFNMMFIIAFISIFGYFYNILVGLIPGVELSEGRYSVILYTQIFGEYFINRNSGMFWEPGAFQGFLNMALFFAMYIKQQRFMRLKILIMITAIITTFSTTGYLALAYIVTLYVLTSKRIKSFVKVPVCVALVIGALYLFESLSFLGEKITENVNSTEGGRIAGYAQWLYRYSGNLLLGKSYVANEDAAVYAGGNGFISHLMFVGIIGVLYYYLVAFSRFCKQTGRSFAVRFLVFLVIIYQGELFIILPFFLAIAFIEFPTKIELRTVRTVS